MRPRFGLPWWSGCSNIIYKDRNFILNEKFATPSEGIKSLLPESIHAVLFRPTFGWPVFRLRSLACSRGFAANCFPLPLPVRGIGRTLCKMVITSPPPTPDGRQKKEPRKKGSFVRIKVLRYNRNLSVYQNIKRTFKAWLPPCPPVLCAALHRVCIFLSDNAKVVKIPEFSKCGKLCGNRRFFVYLVL